MPWLETGTTAAGVRLYHRGIRTDQGKTRDKETVKYCVSWNEKLHLQPIFIIHTQRLLFSMAVYRICMALASDADKQLQEVGSKEAIEREQDK